MTWEPLGSINHHWKCEGDGTDRGRSNVTLTAIGSESTNWDWMRLDGAAGESWDCFVAYDGSGYLYKSGTTTINLNAAFTVGGWVGCIPSEVGSGMHVDFWDIRNDASGGCEAMMMGYTNSSSGNDALWIRTGGDAFSYVLGVTAWGDMEWHHIVATLTDVTSSGVAHVYLDGARVVSDHAIGTTNAGNNRFYVCTSNGQGMDTSATHAVDEFFMDNRCWSAKEIREYYAASKYGDCGGLA